MPAVLVIEDEAPIRRNLARLLTAEGYKVLTAPDGVNGIVIAREQRPELILCDILMPRMDGYAVLEALRSDAGTAAIPLVFLTASADKDDRTRGLASGAREYVTKPFKLAELLAVVRKYAGDATAK
jgi:CheY-like chemotaxis protein